MAFHPDYLGLSAEVLVNDTPLPEHDDPNPPATSPPASPPTIPASPASTPAVSPSTPPPASTLLASTIPSTVTHTSFIPCPTNTSYTLALALPPSVFTDFSVKATIRIDGIYMNDVIFDRAVYDQTGAYEIVGESAAFVGGRDCGQGFRFGNIEIGEHVAAGKEKRSGMTDAGTITVLFHMVSGMRACVKEHVLPELGFGQVVSEKDVKGLGISSKTSLDPMRHVSKVDWVDYDYVHGSHKPFAVFEFKYRSEEALKSLRIIPRTPSPVPLEDRPEEELSNEEKLELIRQFKAEKANAARVKRERPEDGGGGGGGGGISDEDVEMVEERPNRKKQRLPNEEDEVIVLD
ncbi:hypothetical protein NX059_009072 [Plenodomus lindquistii]|nr:hypothetical protein NX059_009072 [Plenodomus lindquistii]